MPDIYLSLYKENTKNHFIYNNEITRLNGLSTISKQKKLLNNIYVIEGQLEKVRFANRKSQEKRNRILKTDEGVVLFSNGVEYKKIGGSAAYLLSKELGVDIEDEVGKGGYNSNDLKEDLEKAKDKLDSEYLTLEKELDSVLQASQRELDLYDFEYFSWITATTTGYGDIFPSSDRARHLAKRQIIVTYFSFAIIVGLIFHFLSMFGETRVCRFPKTDSLCNGADTFGTSETFDR